MKPKILVLYGYGINCDRETERAFELAGGGPERAHLNQLISGEKKLKDYQILALPGGFSFGDDLGAGKVLAAKIKQNLREELEKFIEGGKLIIGICNGFQALVRLDMLPESTLTFNDSGRFEDLWVYLKINQKSPCVWTRGIEKLYLAVRHGEGKFIFAGEEARKRAEKQNQIVLQYVDAMGNLSGYPWNPDGAESNVAGICDETGRILGLMPHPEGFSMPQNHPRWTREKIKEGEGLEVFKNGVNFVKKEL